MVLEWGPHVGQRHSDKAHSACAAQKLKNWGLPEKRAGSRPHSAASRPGPSPMEDSTHVTRWPLSSPKDVGGA